MAEFLTAKQVIDLLHIDRTTLYRMLKEKRISGGKIGGRWRFSSDEIDGLLNRSASTAPAESPELSSEILPLNCIQPIQEVFSDIAQIASVTTDSEGLPLSKFSNPCAFCEMIMSTGEGLRRCRDSWKKLHFTENEKTDFNICHAGLRYAGANISLDGKHIAKLIAGQYFTEKKEREQAGKKISRLAEELNLDEDALYKAARDIPLLDKRMKSFMGKWMLKVAKSFESMVWERREYIKKLKNIAEISKL